MDPRATVEGGELHLTAFILNKLHIQNLLATDKEYTSKTVQYVAQTLPFSSLDEHCRILQVK